jgi:phage-related protein
MVAKAADSPTPKPVEWVGSSKRDMQGFPKAVRRTFGKALFVAQLGGTDAAAKPLSGFGGAGVVELVEDDDGSTYRAVYTVRFAGVVYVRHAFQKKSKRGRKTPAGDIEKIRRRLKVAEKDHAKRVEG